jgi:hypothetical protein
MMAEQKINDAESLIELQLTLNAHPRKEFLEIYNEIFLIKNKKFPPKLLLELVTFKINEGQMEFVLRLLKGLDEEGYYLTKIKLEIQTYEMMGQFHNMYKKISDYLIQQFEKKRPQVDDFILKSIDKYFKNDFGLKLILLSLNISKDDVENSEKITKELIISIFECHHSRSIREKLDSVQEILKTGTRKTRLEIYESICLILPKKNLERNEYKKIIEMIIYFDDFEFKVLVLYVLDRCKLSSLAEAYSKLISKNSKYNFVYLDKFFPHLKKYFFQENLNLLKNRTEEEKVDLVIEEQIKPSWILEKVDFSDKDHEHEIRQILKLSSFSMDQLYDLAISFIQIEMPLIALIVVDEVLIKIPKSEIKLRYLYLKTFCLLQLKDFRNVVDTCFEAIEISSNEKDILSFLYSQAEAFAQLGESHHAKKNLGKIITIDENYRLAKERLKILNEY